MREYEHNGVRAEAANDNKRFAVKGKIDKIDTALFGEPYVSLETGNVIFSVQCMFAAADKQALAQLSPGQEVTIAGICSGKLGNVVMRDCWFYDETAGQRRLAAAEYERRQELAIQKRAEDARKSAAIDAAKWHTWTSADGERHFEGKFLKATGGTVHIEKHDGSVVQISRDKLSGDDWTWVTKKGWMADVQ